MKRFGFMSQISPDGRYVVTSIGPPGLSNKHKDEVARFCARRRNRLYSINFRDLPFIQVFYPTRGILAFYDRTEKKMRPLPGADDPQLRADQRFLVAGWQVPDLQPRRGTRSVIPRTSRRPNTPTIRTKRRSSTTCTRFRSTTAKAARPSRVLGASNNGMSNNFPKVSPDGRWIVFVQNHNGLLMRPDSKLYIVPFDGGKARLMKCNTGA